MLVTCRDQAPKRRCACVCSSREETGLGDATTTTMTTTMIPRGDGTGERTEWVDVERIAAIDPPREWKDIFDQTWRSTAAHYVGSVTGSCRGSARGTRALAAAGDSPRAA